MAALILPRRFNQQPQQPAPLDRSNPLLLGTRGFWSFQNGLDIRDLVSGTVGTFSDTANNFNSASSIAGRGIRSVSNTPRQINTGVLASSMGVSGSADRTVYGAATMFAGDISNAAVFTLGVPSTGQDWSLRRNGGTASWRLNVWGVVSVDFDYAVPTGGSLYFVCTQKGTAIQIWINGGLRGSGTGSVSTTDAQFQIAGGGGYWASYSEPIQFVGVANRAWTDAEKASFSANPWQVFKAPSKRIWAGSVASSGETPVSADLAASYAVASVVNADLAASYAVSATVNSDLAASYGVAQTVSNDLSGSYGVESAMSAVSADLAAAYTVNSALSAVSADLAATYAVAELVNSSLAAAYAMAANVQADLAALYAVAEAAAAVNADLSCTYGIAALVHQDLAASYAVLSDTDYTRAPAGSGYTPALSNTTRPSSGAQSRPAAIQRNNR